MGGPGPTNGSRREVDSAKRPEAPAHRRPRTRRRAPSRSTCRRFGLPERSPGALGDDSDEAANGEERAEMCEKQRRTECSRGEGPRRTHFGGKGRRPFGTARTPIAPSRSAFQKRRRERHRNGARRPESGDRPLSLAFLAALAAVVLPSAPRQACAERVMGLERRFRAHFALDHHFQRSSGTWATFVRTCAQSTRVTNGCCLLPSFGTTAR